MLLGVLAHYVHANFQAYPDKLIDGEDLTDHLLNETLSPNYRWYGRYTVEGWWDEDSSRNLAIHVAPILFTVLIAGLYTWGDRVQVATMICEKANGIGLEPRLCAWTKKGV